MKPFLNWSTSLILRRENKLAVRLVPMLVPMMTGMPCSTVMDPEATMATTREVVAEEDCTREVARIPRARPRAGLVRWAVANREPSTD